MEISANPSTVLSQIGTGQYLYTAKRHVLTEQFRQEVLERLTRGGAAMSTVKRVHSPALHQLAVSSEYVVLDQKMNRVLMVQAAMSPGIKEVGGEEMARECMRRLKAFDAAMYLLTMDMHVLGIYPNITIVPLPNGPGCFHLTPMVEGDMTFDVKAADLRRAVKLPLSHNSKPMSHSELLSAIFSPDANVKYSAPTGLRHEPTRDKSSDVPLGKIRNYQTKLLLHVCQMLRFRLTEVFFSSKPVPQELIALATLTVDRSAHWFEAIAQSLIGDELDPAAEYDEYILTSYDFYFAGRMRERKAVRLNNKQAAAGKSKRELRAA